MAKLHHHANGTYSTERFEDALVMRRIHPDGVIFLKRRSVRIGEDIPPFAMSELVRREWLFSEEAAATRSDVNWTPDWATIGEPPASSVRSGVRSGDSALQVDIPLRGMTATAAPPRQMGIPAWAIGAIVVLALAALFLRMA